jgi:hypothetical protein
VLKVRVKLVRSHDRFFIKVVLDRNSPGQDIVGCTAIFLCPVAHGISAVRVYRASQPLRPPTSIVWL